MRPTFTRKVTTVGEFSPTEHLNDCLLPAYKSSTESKNLFEVENECLLKYELNLPFILQTNKCCSKIFVFWDI